jgi:hypothetical protein
MSKAKRKDTQSAALHVADVRTQNRSSRADSPVFRLGGNRATPSASCSTPTGACRAQLRIEPKPSGR